MSAITNINAMPITEVELTSTAEKTVQTNDNKEIEKNIVNSKALSKTEESNTIKSADIDSKAKEDMISTSQLEEMAQQLQNFVGGMNKSLLFSVDKDSGRDVLKVIDRNNGDVIKQYPSEEVLSIVAKLSEAAGTFINEQV